VWSNTDDGGAAGGGGLASLLLEFFRATFDELEAIKLELANQHLAQLLHANDGLAALIARQPSDFVVLLNAADGAADWAADGGASALGLAIDAAAAADASARRAAGLLSAGGLLSRGSSAASSRRAAAAPTAAGDGARSLLGGGDDDEGEESAEGDGEDDLDDDDDDEPPLASPLAPRGYDDLLAGRFAAAASLGAGPSALGAGASLNQHGLGGYYGVGLGGVGGAPYGGHGLGVGPPEDTLLRYELPPTQVHSELMEAVMQQWLQTAAGQGAAQEAARLQLGAEEAGQFFHARMLQSLGRLRLDETRDGLAPLGAPDDGHLEEDDEAAVDRLAALGFARSAAVEAYIACNRDEMLAANFLVDQQ